MSTSVTFKNPVSIHTFIDQFNFYFTHLDDQYAKLSKPTLELITEFQREVYRFLHDPNRNQYHLDHEPGKDILTFYGYGPNDKLQWTEIKEDKGKHDTYYILSKKGVDPIYIHTYVKDSNLQYEVGSGDANIPSSMVDIFKLFSNLLHGMNDQEIYRQTEQPVSRVHKALYQDILFLTDRAYRLNLTHADYVDKVFDTYQKTIDYLKKHISSIRYTMHRDDEGCLESIAMHDISRNTYLKLNTKTPSFIVAYQNIYFEYTGDELRCHECFIRGGGSVLSKVSMDNKDILLDKEEGQTPFIVKAYIDSLTKAFPYIWTNII